MPTLLHRSVLLAAALALVAGCSGYGQEPTEPTTTTHSVITDLAYRDGATGHAAERCRLDLYLPAGRTSPPVVAWFHGGGLHHGDKTEVHATVVATRLAESGVAVALVNYRLNPRVTYPDYIRDAAAAVAWLIREGAGHGVDPGAVFVGGHSAGAYLTAMVGLVDDYLAEHQTSRDAIAGLIPVSGQMRTHSRVCAERGDEAEERPIDEAAPLAHARADSPPWLFLCAEGERIEAENQQMVDALLAAGHPDCTLVRVAGRDHMSMVMGTSEPDDEVTRSILEFIRRVRDSRK